jgi:hypothetical protein
MRLVERDMSSPMELRFKAALEAQLGAPFAKARPAWLTNPATGRSMELDMFNETLCLAVEYNGAQHYKFPNKFHRSKKKYDAQLERDRVKANLCAARGVRLVSIRARGSIETELADFGEQMA